LERAKSAEEQKGPVLLLGTIGREKFEVDANVVATGRTCVIGASGSGKSYAVSVICEELCKNNVPFAIIDTEGEHAGLREKHRVIWVGDEEGCDLQWSSVDTKQLASQAPDIAPLILDLSEAEDPKAIAGDIIGKIYDEVERRRTPYLIIVEEADRFIPQNGDRVPIFGEIARRGRKRGMGLMVCTQRPSLVDKNILSQCGNQLIGKLVIRNDLQAVAQFFAGHELPRQLTGLPAGTFYAMGGLSPAAERIVIRQKETHYGGTTPKLGERTVKPFDVTAARDPEPDDEEKDDDSPQKTIMGFRPTFSEEDVPQMVKKDKRFHLFGKEETVVSARLTYLPFVEVGVAVRMGVIRKRVNLRYFTLQGDDGRFVDISEVPTFREGFMRLRGLKASQLEVLSVIKTDGEMSSLEIANMMGVTKESLRGTLKALEERKLVRSVQKGRSRLYVRAFEFSEPLWQEAELPVESLPSDAAKGLGWKMTEGEIAELVKGTVPDSIVHTCQQFAYPTYKVELLMGNRKRIVWIDGRTAKEMLQ
jgi:uncharacterized protein